MTTFEKLEDLIYKGFKETDRKFQETDRKFRETDRILKESSRETERILKELSRETELEIQKVNQKVGEISDSLGRFAESMVAPAVLSLFNQRGIPIKGSFQRIRSRERRIEFDVVAFNTEYVVVVSVKMTLRVTDVEHFLNKRLPIFKELFPQYKDMKVVGAVAGAVILGESDRYAMKRGLYVLAQSGENITLLNDEAFEAKIF